MLLWIFPALAHLLFAAHLMFHGAPIGLATMPVACMGLWLARRRWVLWAEAFLLIVFSFEWARAGYALVQVRLANGEPWHTAALIMGGVALFTLLSALVLTRPAMKQRYAD